MRTRFHRMQAARRDDERGYVMVITALIIVPLLAFAGFAVDIGSWYAEAAKIQRAADAGALAGVVWMPDITKATDTAITAVARNGYVDKDSPGGMPGIDVEVSDAGNQRLRVEIIDHQADTYFSHLFLDRDVELARSATAEYVLPVPMGSPEFRFGNDSSTGYGPNFWASISGPFTGYANGDPYATKCSGNSTGEASCPESASNNLEYQRQTTTTRNGYRYAVDVPANAAGSTFQLQFFDAGFYDRGTLNYPYNSTHDIRIPSCSPWPECAPPGGLTTRYVVTDTNGTPFNDTDNVPVSCALGPGAVTIPPETNAASYRDRWATLCAFTVPTGGGRYLLDVTTSGFPGGTPSDSGNGWNQYALKATTSGGGQPRIYGIGDMSIFVNSNSTTKFHLAEVAPIHAGKTLLIDLFDPGDGASGDYFVKIRGPQNSPGLNSGAPSCRYGVRDSGSTSTSSTCTIQTRSSAGNLYNGKWLRIEVAVPPVGTYTCDPDCWWKVEYQFGADPNDRTVWSAKIVGDPVHLVNESG